MDHVSHSAEHQVNEQPHFVLIPLFASGHMIPMVDMAELLARHGDGRAVVSLVTTPVNAARIDNTIRRLSAELPQLVRFVVLPLPCAEVGLPDGCENVDLLPCKEDMPRLLRAATMLQEPLERHLRSQQPPPSCVIADFGQFWAVALARGLQVPRLVFHGFGAFPLLCWHNLHESQAHTQVSSNSEPFLVPGLPGGRRIEISRGQLPTVFHAPVARPEGTEADYQRRIEMYRQIRENELTADGVVINSFDALEPKTVAAYQAATGKKVWTLGPLSILHHREHHQQQQKHSNSSIVVNRGNMPAIDEARCLAWLGSQKPSSVVYASFGSIARPTPLQLKEVGLGLERSGHPFIFVVKTAGTATDMEWLAELEERVRASGGDSSVERGIVIRGWAPQLLILSHASTGAFLTHCGWNSVLEGITAGLPLITWPHFGDQFLNEKLAVDELGIGVSLGVKEPTTWGEEHKARVQVSREMVARAVKEVLGGVDEKAETRRNKARELGMAAMGAMEIGGSSHSNFRDIVVTYVRN